jgi:hypothetical protein
MQLSVASIFYFWTLLYASSPVVDCPPAHTAAKWYPYPFIVSQDHRTEVVLLAPYFAGKSWLRGGKLFSSLFLWAIYPLETPTRAMLVLMLRPSFTDSGAG